MRYIYIYIHSETSLQGDREEYVTQENDGKKKNIYIYIYIDIYENLKSLTLES